MVTNNWIKDNWQFLSRRHRVEVPACQMYKLLQDKEFPFTGKFYGTGEFWKDNSPYGGDRGNVKSLLLRPYIISEMPEEDIVAIYIDPKRYKMDKNGKIEGTVTLWEFPIYIIKKD